MLVSSGQPSNAALAARIYTQRKQAKGPPWSPVVFHSNSTVFRAVPHRLWYTAAKSGAQSHRIRVQIGGLGAQAYSCYSCTPSTETVEMGP